MATATPPQDERATRWTAAELLEALGDIPPDRVWLRPAPGTATERDVIEVNERTDRNCELVDGTLVEKPMGAFESLMAALLVGYFDEYLKRNDLGIVLGADGALRLMPGLVRTPDVSFLSWDRLRDTARLKKEKIPPLAPDLAVEVLSESNTPKEMRRKVREYFDAGARLVWIADPEGRTVRVHNGPEAFTTLSESDTLDGGDVLPGFALRIADWFARAERRGPR